MRTAPTATVSSPPATAANMMATPSGWLQVQPRKANFVDSVFCAMKISSTIRTRKPSTSDPHRAAALVNLTADSGGGGALLGDELEEGFPEDGFPEGGFGGGGFGAGGFPGDADGSLVIAQ